MMGLATDNDGQWSSVLWNITNSAATHSEKVAINLAKIYEEISDAGIAGMFSLFTTKIRIVWSEGMTAILGNFSTVEDYGFPYSYIIGNQRFIMCYSSQIVRCVTLFGMIPMVWKRRKKTDISSIIPLTSIGYAIFYLFWEASDKYILMLLPLLVAGAERKILRRLLSYIEGTQD